MFRNPSLVVEKLMITFAAWRQSTLEFLQPLLNFLVILAESVNQKLIALFFVALWSLQCSVPLEKLVLVLAAYELHSCETNLNWNPKAQKFLQTGEVNQLSKCYIIKKKSRNDDSFANLNSKNVMSTETVRFSCVKFQAV